MKKYLTTLALLFSYVLCSGQSQFKFLNNIGYDKITEIGHGVYLGVSDSSVFLIDYKGNSLINKKFDSYFNSPVENLILTLKLKRSLSKKEKILGLYNYRTRREFDVHNLGNFKGEYGNKFFFEKGIHTYSVDPFFYVSKLPNFDSISISSPYFTIYHPTNFDHNGLEVGHIEGYKNLIQVEKVDPSQIPNIADKKGNKQSEKESKHLFGIYDLKDGKCLIYPQYYEIGSLDATLLRVIKKDKNKPVYIDYQNRVVLDSSVMNYDACGDFHEGLAPVRVKGKWGFANIKGRLVIHSQFNDDEDNGDSLIFQHDLCLVREGNKFGLINNHGTFIIPPVYEALSPIENMDQDENDKKEKKFVYCKELKAYLFMFLHNGQVGIITSANQVVKDDKLGVSYFNSQFVCKENKKMLSIDDLAGAQNIKIPYDSVLNIDKDLGLLLLKNKGECCIYNLHGEKIFQSNFEDMLKPADQNIWVKKDGKWYLGYSGNITAPIIKKMIVQNLDQNNHQIVITSEITSYTKIDSINIFVGDQKIVPQHLSKSYSNGRYRCVVNEVISCNTKQPFVLVTINSENMIGNSYSTRVVQFPAYIHVNSKKKHKKLAILIGNKHYVSLTQLDNALNDVKQMAAAMSKMNYTVIIDTDLNYNSFLGKIVGYQKTIKKYDQIVVYFSGHGFAYHDTQYLLPIDAFDDNQQKTDQLINLNYLTSLNQSKRKSFVFIIDACRTIPEKLKNSFLDKHEEEKKKDLSDLIQTNTFIWFSTKKNSNSSDSHPDFANSLFTGALLQLINTKGMEINTMFNYVNFLMSKDYYTIDNKQISVQSSTLSKDFYFDQ